MKNYYNILGIPENASDTAIAEAFKKLAVKFHPDKNEGDLFFAERFKQVNEAYQVLVKKDEKRDYDEMLYNYSDAYEILKQQQHNEHLNRSVNRKKNSSHKKSNYTWWMIGCVALICAGILFWLNDSETKGFTSATAPVDEQEALPKVLEVASHLSQPGSINVTSVADQSTKKTVSTQSARLITNSKKSASILQENRTGAVEGRRLGSNEIDQIISKLNSRNFNKGVRVTQSFNSDIKRDFAIVSILQKNGFTILGRNFTTENVKGIHVNETENFLNLIIGKIGKQ